MAKLEQLIQEKCPNGVEYRKLKDIAEIGTGSSNGNEAIDNGKYPFFIRSQIVKAKNDYEYDEEAIIIPGEGGIGEIFHYINGKYAIHQRVYRIHFTSKDIDTKFAFHYMKGNFKSFIVKKAVNATVSSIRKPMIEDFELPVPPLEVQREIVEVLDKFTLLTAELTAELTARKEQFNFYKEQLLDEDCEVKKLSEVATVTDSLHATPKYVDNGYSMIRVADVKEGYIETNKTLKVDENTYKNFIKRYKPKYNDIIISRVGSFGNFSLVPNEDVCLGQNVALIHPHINNKYLYHFLKSNYVMEYVNRNAHGGGYKNIGIKDILDIPIKVPTNEKQQEIADILDKYDALCNDISSGLPAEIETRQKQYEYYRDKLLTFKRMEA